LGGGNDKSCTVRSSVAAIATMLGLAATKSVALPALAVSIEGCVVAATASDVAGVPV
jgi:hypothetical protein